MRRRSAAPTPDGEQLTQQVVSAYSVAAIPSAEERKGRCSFDRRELHGQRRSVCAGRLNDVGAFIERVRIAARVHGTRFCAIVVSQTLVLVSPIRRDMVVVLWYCQVFFSARKQMKYS